LTGSLTPVQTEAVANVEYASAISKKVYKLLSAIAFFGVVFFIFKGAWWTLFLLFMVADALKDVVYLTVMKKTIADPVVRTAALDATKKQKKKRKREGKAISADEKALGSAAPRPTSAIPLDREYEFSSPVPSVTEGTTRHLEDSREESVNEAASRPRYEAPNAR